MSRKKKSSITYSDFTTARDIALARLHWLTEHISNLRYSDKDFSDMFIAQDCVKEIGQSVETFLQYYADISGWERHKGSDQ